MKIETNNWKEAMAGFRHAKDQDRTTRAVGDRKLTGSCSLDSDPIAQRKICQTHNANFVYYIKEWGNVSGREINKPPFNAPSWVEWAWGFDQVLRASQTQQWEAR